MMVDFSGIPVFRELVDIEQLAEVVTLAAGETLFAEGDLPRYAWMRLSGHCILSQQAVPQGEARSGEILDLLAILGGTAHQQRAITAGECQFLRWDVSVLEVLPDFQRAARAYLAGRIQQAESRTAELEAPIHYLPNSAELLPGPFVFDYSTMLFLFCDAYLQDLALPPGVSLLGNSLLIVLAQFRNAHSELRPDARFSYTETTFFVPVRYGVRLGLYVPYIYPSTFEPILLGREIYGFPKQPGRTSLQDDHARLKVDGDTVLDIQWKQRQQSSEPRIVGAFGTCFGAQGRLTAAAFAIGDTLLAALRVPFYRRVSVFNHKRIPGAATRSGAVVYDADLLTQAIFSVQRWNRIEALTGVALDVGGHLLESRHIHLREAYLTQLDLRLSTGRVLRDYRTNPDGR